MTLDPVSSYQRSVELIRFRLLAIEDVSPQQAPLVRAEQIALQVRKIVEGVAFAALSAFEHRNQSAMAQQRTKDADDLLTWLNAKNLLRLPAAQRVEPSPSAEYKAVFSGAPCEDVTLQELKAAYSRASALIHERHPERLTKDQVAKELVEIEGDARRLRSWLWLHIMFHRGEGFLVQMGQYGSPSFFVPLERAGDLPSDV